MNPHDTTLVPSLQDLHAPATGCHGGFREELPCQDADAFPPAQDLTAAEDAELHALYLSRLEDERRAAACVEAFAPLTEAAEAVRERLLSRSIFVEAICRSCGACLLIQVGTPVEQVFCPGCALVEVA